MPSAAPHFAVLTDLDDATLVSMPYCCIDAFLTFFSVQSRTGHIPTNNMGLNV